VEVATSVAVEVEAAVVEVGATVVDVVLRQLF